MRYITLAIAFLICTNARAQVIRAEPFYTAPEVVSGNLLLDDYPGAAVAYSLRKLDKDYTGSAIRVRRSSDNTEQDIGFLASGFLDTAAMKTFVGANNGFVVTWYNQADSAGVFGTKNVSQSTAGNQPQIMSSGAVVYKNGEAALHFPSSDFLINPQLAYTTNTLFATSVSSRESSASNQTILSQNSELVAGRSNVMAYSVANKANYFFNNGTSYNNESAGTTTTGAQNLITCYSYSNNYYTALNGSSGNNQVSGQSFTPVSSLGFSIGSQPNGTNTLNGHIHEVIVWNSDKSSDKSAIESNINSFYSIY